MSDDASARAAYVHNNRDKFAYYASRQRDKLKLEMVKAYGGKCVHCEISNPMVLMLDHIYEDAHVEKELYGNNARGGHKNYQRLKAEGWPKDRFQLLCYNCNAVKEHNRRRDEMEGRWGKEQTADRQIVQAKIGLRKSNTSGLKGVFWNSNKRRWHVAIMVDYKKRHIGFFVDPFEAAMAYRSAAKKIWGEAANLQTDDEIREAIEKLKDPFIIESSAEELGL